MNFIQFKNSEKTPIKKPFTLRCVFRACCRPKAYQVIVMKNCWSKLIPNRIKQDGQISMV